MNTRELEQLLQAEGCNPGSYAIGVRGRADDAYCLTHNGVEWQVYYTERGVDQAPLFSCADEAEACAFFYAHIMGFRHDHCVGYFRSQAAAQALERTLAAHGVAVLHDSLPAYLLGSPRYRVFVVGKDIFQARAVLGTLPVSDA